MRLEAMRTSPDRVKFHLTPGLQAVCMCVFCGAQVPIRPHPCYRALYVAGEEVSGSRRPTSPFERRFEEIKRHWLEFAEAYDPRLLRWVTHEYGAGLIYSWLDAASESDPEMQDAFLTIEGPFRSKEQFHEQVLAELVMSVEQANEELAADGVAVAWVLPLREEGESDARHLVRSLRHLQKAVRTLARAVVVVLRPGVIEAPKAWMAWLMSVLEADLPLDVRLTWVDAFDPPLCSELEESADPRVWSVHLELDVLGAVEDTAHEAAGDGPDAVFRRHMATFGRAAAEGDYAQAEASSRAARAVADAAQWAGMTATVDLAWATMLTAQGRHAEALEAYRDVQPMLTQEPLASEAGSAMLRMQSKFGEAGALFGLERPQEAAMAYRDAANLAAEAGDQVLGLEGWRMSAFCFGRAEAFQEAWEASQAALDVAASMPEGLRAASSLPYLAVSVFGFERSGDPALDHDVRRRLEELLPAEALDEAKARARAS